MKAFLKYFEQYAKENIIKLAIITLASVMISNFFIPIISGISTLLNHGINHDVKSLHYYSHCTYT